MDVTKIPFVNKVGIIRLPDGSLELPMDKTVINHLGTVHAGAQFVLAETASGELLQTLFPELSGKVIPVLRDSNIKFKKPAQYSVSAYPSVTDDSISKFNEQFLKKGRSSITVNVEVKDNQGIITSSGQFNWFIQSVS